MIKCSGCGKSLPDGYLKCQFCGADVSAVERPVPVQKPRQSSSLDPPSWIKPAYTVTCILFMLLGTATILTGLKSYPTIVFGAIDLGLGFGMLLKIELIRGIANILCWFQVAVGLYRMAFALILVTAVGAYALLALFMTVLQVAIAGFFIYLISETDEFAHI